MASNVSTNNLPGTQQAPDTQLIPDETVYRILDRAKSQLGETEVRKLVEALEKVSREHLIRTHQRIQQTDHRCRNQISD